MSRRVNRRKFLRDSALAGFSIYVARTSFGAESKSPNEKLNMACIGVGGKGESDTDDASRENLVALCDVDDEKARKTFKKFPDVPRFKDFRVMLDKMGKQINAVTISTPDHIHAPAAIMAMAMGKHVFVQKPLTRTVWESRMLAEAAKKYKVATQMGNQGTGNDNLRRAVEILHAGVLGPVRELHVWTNRPIWPQGIERPKESEPVPETLDWDLWLGPAPKRPYHHCYLPFNWRGWYDFGTGAFGDMACHTLNMPYWGLKLCPPVSIEGEVSKLMPETFPSWSVVRYEIPAREGLPPIKMTWYDGKKRVNGQEVPNLPPRELFGFKGDEKVSGSGSLIIGEKGKMYSWDDYGERWRLLPEDDWKDFKGPEQTIPRSPGHFREWILACKGGKPAQSNFPDYASLLNEIVVLGCVAQRLPGRKLEWDGASMTIKNAPEAAALVKPDLPKGWWI